MSQNVIHDFDEVFKTIHINNTFPYNEEESNILINGYISLNNAVKRLPKKEYYSLVVYDEGQVLPPEYVSFEPYY